MSKKKFKVKIFLEPVEYTVMCDTAEEAEETAYNEVECSNPHIINVESQEVVE